MPGPALFLVLLRGAGAVAARAAVVGSRAAAARVIAGARLLSRAGARLASNVARFAHRVSTIAMRGARAFLRKAYMTLRGGANLIRRLVSRVVNSFLSTAASLNRRITTILTGLDKQVGRKFANLIKRSFNDAVARSQSEFDDQIDSYLNDPRYDKTDRMLALEAHRHNVLKKYTDLVNFVVEQTQMSDDELLEQLTKAIVPDVVAARIVATGDPTAGLDVDSDEHIARLMTELVEFVNRVRQNDTLANRTRLVQYLIDETMRAAKAASFRQNLLAQLSRDRIAIDIDNAVMGAISAQRSRDVRLASEEEIEATREVVGAISQIPHFGDSERTRAVGTILSAIGQISWRLGLRMIEDFVTTAARMNRAFVFDYLRIAREARNRLRFLTRFDTEDVAEDEPVTMRDIRDVDRESMPEDIELTNAETIATEEAPRDEGELLVDDEQDVIYGVWLLNARRQTQYHCADCEALEALTSLAPVPIYELPQPGTETQCGFMCGCDIVEVDEGEHQKVYQSWEGVYQSVFNETLPSKFDEIPREILPSLLHFVHEDYDTATKWAKKLGIIS